MNFISPVNCFSSQLIEGISFLISCHNAQWWKCAISTGNFQLIRICSIFLSYYMSRIVTSSFGSQVMKFDDLKELGTENAVKVRVVCILFLM